MSGGDIAAIIAASAFALFVLFTAIPLVKLGRLIDETSASVRELSEDVSPLLTGLTETVTETNKQLARIDVITENAAEVSQNISSLVAVFTASVGSPLVKIAGFAKSLSGIFLNKK
ncbi:unannotated protein [freshwater metagenome]|uniref:Unannotated protein n=1 Tax=freshwater metagenome TaxID=449393 RepID=A0A6J7KYM0_9ZZZZ|nr:DUF948 domain-containing protein [Actinomycetota bacterium]